MFWTNITPKNTRIAGKTAFFVHTQKTKQKKQSKQNKRRKQNQQRDKEGLGSSEEAPPHLTLNWPKPTQKTIKKPKKLKRKTKKPVRFRVRWGGPSGLTSPKIFQRNTNKHKRKTQKKTKTTKKAKHYKKLKEKKERAPPHPKSSKPIQKNKTNQICQKVLENTLF